MDERCHPNTLVNFSRVLYITIFRLFSNFRFLPVNLLVLGKAPQLLKGSKDRPFSYTLKVKPSRKKKWKLCKSQKPYKTIPFFLLKQHNNILPKSACCLGTFLLSKYYICCNIFSPVNWDFGNFVIPLWFL
jgi:hypothetical protein